MPSQKRGAGRPAIGKGEPVTVRLQPDILSALDAYRAADPRRLNRPQAIRSLLKMTLGSPTADRERRAQELMEKSRARHARRGKNGAAQ